MIYSEAFDAIPEPAKELVYQRLFDVLNGKDSSGVYDHIPKRIRQAILEILSDTKPGLPDYWKAPEDPSNS